MGRFAPSPSGDLHLGSLYAATASYLDARANSGRWLVRMEDLDQPRAVAGSSERILATLAAFGFDWDGPVLYQSSRLQAYDQALATLSDRLKTFRCSCSRSQLADERYPGTCREGPSRPHQATATRLRVETETIDFTDRIQGRFRQDVASAVGDFILERRDRIIAYVLAVVVDDAAQRVTHVVRGADLLDNTPRQIYLQRQLSLHTPLYAHVPVLVERGGDKLSKSARSVSLDPSQAQAQLLLVLGLLGIRPAAELRRASLADLWVWAIANWQVARVPKCLSQPLNP